VSIGFDLSIVQTTEINEFGTDSKYMPFVKVGVSLDGDWFAVRDVDGDVHWIYKTLLTNQYKGAVVKANGVNVRTGPGTKYTKSTSLSADKYYTFKVLQRKGSWVSVKNPVGDIGWIHGKFLWIR
jgi:SH3-like domain-containing protein